MCDIDTVGDVTEEKKPLNPTDIWMIRIEELSKIRLYLQKPIRKRHSRSRLDNTVFDNTRHPLFLLEKSKTNRRESWIKSEDYHEDNYMEKL